MNFVLKGTSDVKRKRVRTERRVVTTLSSICHYTMVGT